VFLVIVVKVISKIYYYCCYY